MLLQNHTPTALPLHPHCVHPQPLHTTPPPSFHYNLTCSLLRPLPLPPSFPPPSPHPHLQFYRWLSERYPKINQIISDTTLLPPIDHLYLDMNGIIHGASHPPSVDLLSGGGLSDKDMFLGIMHYLNRIVDIVKPQQTIYMAIDGVAPRAKMNQQRSRRFRSAKDMEDEKQQRLEKGEVLQEREGEAAKLTWRDRAYE